MKFDNEELVEIADDCIKSLELALSELEGVEEYKEVFIGIKADIDMLIELSEPYQEAVLRENEEQREYENREYERSVL